MIHRSELSLEQEYVLQQFEEGHNLFITGPAGTGKTCLIKQMIASAVERNKTYQVCAMTGCAAILLGCAASTVHSWSGIRLGKGTIDEIYAMLEKNKKACAKWRRTQILIIDEVSMMSKRLFDILNVIGKKVRKKHLWDSFGGIQLIFTGDFYQLPPVSGPEEDSSSFCFESEEWYNTFLLENHIILGKVFRQKDPVYRTILNNIRVGKIDSATIKTLQPYVNREYDKTKHNGCVPTKLYAITRKVEHINQTMFQALETKCYEYNHTLKHKCTTFIESGKPISSMVLEKCYKELIAQKKVEMEFEYLLSNCQCERTLQLKKGANVMCTVNLDLDAGICNGSIGGVEDFLNASDDAPIPIVRFSNGVRRPIHLKYWQNEEYPVLAIGQIPLRLAWAITIHKSQGATLSIAEVDIGNSIFEYGQSYVALSRVQSLDGLYLSGFDPTKIKIHPKVSSFYEKIPQIEYEEEEDEEEDEEEEEDEQENTRTDKKAAIKNTAIKNTAIKNITFEQFSYNTESETTAEISDPNIRTINL